MRHGQAGFSRDFFELRQLRPEVAGKEYQQEQDGPNHGGWIDYSAWLRNNSEQRCVPTSTKIAVIRLYTVVC